MRRKTSAVQCEFHPIITAFLFIIDDWFRTLEAEAIITSGSEKEERHGYTSLHYATPAQAVDIRSWNILYSGISYTAKMQNTVMIQLAADFCIEHNIPADWLEVILESNHHHIEYQPKRLEGV